MMPENKIERDAFYQSKYNYYKILNKWVIILSSFAEVAYFVSDCQLFGRFAYETLLPRCFILLPMLLFLIVEKRVSSYKVMVPLSYFVIHAAMWCTIWAIVFLPIKTHASEGFIIMHLMFLAVGFCAPKKMAILFHSLIIINILASNLFNHYENLDIMLSLGIPCLVGICAIQVVMEKVYKDQYQTKKQLEHSLVYDQLTMVYNRNKLLHICVKESKVLIFQKAGFLMMDIDDFKNVNDEYGHETGDKILVSIAECIQKCTRKSDYVLRWGGEEFLVILPEADIDCTLSIAEEIRKAVETFDNGICKVTISIGASLYTGGDYHIAVSEADDALYFAKKQGKNRISTVQK